MQNDKSCAVFGHRDVEDGDKIVLREKLYFCFEDLICNKQVGCFYFGGFSDFDDMCHEIITELKNKYPFIKRIYVCEDYKFIDRPHKRPKWLKNEDYEEFTYFDMQYTGFYQRIYFRNCEIIDYSDYIVFCIRHKNNSGSYKAFQYAQRKKKEIIKV